MRKQKRKKYRHLKKVARRLEMIALVNAAFEKLKKQLEETMTRSILMGCFAHSRIGKMGSDKFVER